VATKNDLAFWVKFWQRQTTVEALQSVHLAPCAAIVSRRCGRNRTLAVAPDGAYLRWSLVFIFGHC
jgi:hypothetical protein